MLNTRVFANRTDLVPFPVGDDHANGVVVHFIQPVKVHRRPHGVFDQLKHDVVEMRRHVCERLKKLRRPDQPSDSGKRTRTDMLQRENREILINIAHQRQWVTAVATGHRQRMRAYIHGVAFGVQAT